MISWTWRATPRPWAQGKDALADKATYVKFLGLDGARQAAGDRLEAALAAIGEFGASADMLRELAQYIVRREH